MDIDWKKVAAHLVEASMGAHKRFNAAADAENEMEMSLYGAVAGVLGVLGAALTKGLEK